VENKRVTEMLGNVQSYYKTWGKVLEQGV